jgi:preprotein translocase subunit SecY
MHIVESFQNIFKIPELRKRIFWTFGLLVVFRLGSHVALPGVNPGAIGEFQEQMSREGGSIFALMQVFSGGALGNLALFSLGIMPYITASIIMQLMTKVSPALEAIAKEGPSGQRKIHQYTRYAAIPVCIVQGLFAARQLSQMSAIQVANNKAPLLMSPGFGGVLFLMMGLMGGALFIMWLGEQITDRGIGNGASVLIMAGIIARMPAILAEMIREAQNGAISADAIVIVLAVYLGTVVAVVFVTQAQRRIPLQHAKHIRGRRMMSGGRNYLPLRVNTSGVMPVIFASSLLVLPQMLSLIPGMKWFGEIFQRGWFFYSIFYVTTIIFFSYFWTYLFFPPQEIALQLKESGSFVPGIRPGENTAQYLNSILSRITLCGAVFLCIIALLPDLISVALRVDRYLVAFLGGTGILIVVGVGLDIIQKIESYLLMHHYGGFLGPGGIRGRRGGR